MEKDLTSANRPSSSMSSLQSSVSNSGRFYSFKTQLPHQIKNLQRSVAEPRQLLAAEKTRMDKIIQQLTETREISTNIDSRLANLQIVVAGQVDKNNTLQKEVTDKDNYNKELIEALKLEFASFKQTLEDISKRTEETRRRRNAVAGGTDALPEIIKKMFDAIERQLGMYDVKIAEYDVKFQLLEATSYDGKLIWKIMEFSRRRDDAKRGGIQSIYSQPFYTSKYGYKMCLRAYLNGDGIGKNTHISLFFVLMQGNHDSLLPFPFRQKVTLMLLDQGPDKRHLSDVFRPDPASSSFKKPTSDMNVASGCPRFVSHDVINGSNYVRDGTIFIRVVVDTSDLENY